MYQMAEQPESQRFPQVFIPFDKVFIFSLVFTDFFILSLWKVRGDGDRELGFRIKPKPKWEKSFYITEIGAFYRFRCLLASS